MIEKLEIDEKSVELGVHASHVQRDYVFGWLLSSIYRPENELNDLLILKGGNCLRKAYFQQARYSNDLDFATQTELSENLLVRSVRDACIYANEKSGVEFDYDRNQVRIRELVDQEVLFYEARIYFKSFYGEENFTLKVKLDIKEFDRIYLPIQKKQIIHDYSDSENCTAELCCIKLEEFLASKLSALIQRQYSPDLYDFIYGIFFQNILNVNRIEVITTFLKKTIYEKNPRTVRNLLLNLPVGILKELWKQYLVCPKLSIISFDDALHNFIRVINELFDLILPQFVTSVVSRGPSLSFFNAERRNLIMEAGRLKRLLQVVYNGYRRTVEPYALTYKRRKDGEAREYFYVWDRSGGSSGYRGIKSFVSENLQSISITDRTFEPRYPIEFGKSMGYFSKPFSSTSKTRINRPFKKRSTRISGMTFKFRCMACGKIFTRKKYNPRLNPHKNRSGQACYGRIGTQVY